MHKENYKSKTKKGHHSRLKVKRLSSLQRFMESIVYTLLNHLNPQCNIYGNPPLALQTNEMLFRLETVIWHNTCEGRNPPFIAFPVYGDVILN